MYSCGGFHSFFYNDNSDIMMIEIRSIAMKLDIIGTQMDYGASRTGVNMGPLAIRHAGLYDSIKEMGYQVRDKGDIVPTCERIEGDKKLRFLKPICEANKALHDTVLETLKSGAMPIVLGGDHSISAGSISAASSYYENIGVIWIDAHGDFNDENSSPTGNIHGMPLSALCGKGPDCLVEFSDKVFVNPKNVCSIAIRLLDTEERIRMKEAGITVFTMSDIDELGISEVMRRALEITLDGTKGVYVSYDMDSIEPSEAPGVGTPVLNGLTAREAHYVAEALAKSGKIIGIDLVEVNPMLDTENKTGKLAADLILSLLGKRVY